MIFQDISFKVVIYFSADKCYHMRMKGKRLTLCIFTLVLVAVLAVTLTACLKIGMREKNVVERLEGAGASVAYERTAPMTLNGQSGYRIGNILHATMVVTEGENEEEQHLYVYFAQDVRSADWIEGECKSYVKQNGDETAHWITYRFEEVVMVGHFRLVAIARQY